MEIQALLRAALAWIRALGPWGPACFTGIYVLACVLFIPGSLLTLGAGLLYGVAKGSVLVSLASTSGAACAFLIGRHLAREAIARKLQGRQKFQALDAAIAREGWKIVGLVRLSPIFPFNLLNYALGLTRVSFKDYLLASWIGMLPGTIMYVYIGSLAADLASLGASGRSRTPAEWALYGVGLAATVAVVLYVSRIARQALETRV